MNYGDDRVTGMQRVVGLGGGVEFRHVRARNRERPVLAREASSIIEHNPQAARRAFCLLLSCEMTTRLVVWWLRQHYVRVARSCCCAWWWLLGNLMVASTVVTLHLHYHRQAGSTSSRFLLCSAFSNAPLSPVLPRPSIIQDYKLNRGLPGRGLEALVLLRERPCA